MASLLLYNFSEGEAAQLTSLLGFLPDTQVIPVPEKGWGMTLDQILSGQTPPAIAFPKPMERKLLVIADAQGELFHMLLSAVGQVTKGQNILRAMLTETNRSWSGSDLYEHLLEEEAELAALR